MEEKSGDQRALCREAGKGLPGGGKSFGLSQINSSDLNSRLIYQLR